MGLIRAALKSAGGVFADQWKEYFYCDALNADTLVVKGQKRMGRRSANRKGSDNIITNGSVIAVADGQCMILVDQGRVAEVCAEPGEFIYDSSTEPTVFCGDLAQGLADTFEMIGKRFTFGGEPPKDQRVYYVNIKEITGNKYGTANPVPFRVVDQNIGLDLDIAIRCFGEYSYRISDPILFYTNVCGNVADAYTRMELDSQLKSELQTALQPAFARISGMGIRYSALPGHTMELADALNEVLSSKWRELRGLEIVSFGVSSVKASEEDEAMMKELQRNATFRDPEWPLARPQLWGRRRGTEASPDVFWGSAAPGQKLSPWLHSPGREGAGSSRACRRVPGLGSPRQADTWVCSCGATVSGNFCGECGKKRPEPQQAGWTCPSCGTVNQGKFCQECGARKPSGVPLYRCDKCGWQPEDPMHPPKFCPECGDPFDDNDIA